MQEDPIHAGAVIDDEFALEFEDVEKRAVRELQYCVFPYSIDINVNAALIHTVHRDAL